MAMKGRDMPGHKASEAERREQILRAAHEIALRRGIDGLTVRAVAARARLSHGLVLFHFKRKDQLGLALLDRVLATTLAVTIPDDIAAISNPPERLQRLFRHEVQRLSQEPRRIRLLLEYWARGAHNTVIREKISSGLDSYRMAFRNAAEKALQSESGPLKKGTASALAATAVSLILGYPVQAMIDPDHLAVAEYLAAVDGILGHLSRAA
jgi:AcrR family transcriptional regulator